MDPDGYAWWYLDGLSGDGRYGVSVIGFIGSVFSPYYSWTGRRDPLNHACINVALYGPKGRWAMTERGRGAVTQTPESFVVGPSALHWDGEKLVVHVDERSNPDLRRVRGRITLRPAAITDQEVLFHANHVWRPFAPSAQVEVELDQPDLSWSGHGYMDANFGTAALEADFRSWTWARFETARGAAIFYDVVPRRGAAGGLALSFDRAGRIEVMEAPPVARLPRNLWAVKRETRADPGYRPHRITPMLDAPFYSRTAIRTQIHGEVAEGVHAALDLDRFRNRFIQFMLAMRMPRALGTTRRFF